MKPLLARDMTIDPSLWQTLVRLKMRACRPIRAMARLSSGSTGASWHLGELLSQEDVVMSTITLISSERFWSAFGHSSGGNRRVMSRASQSGSARARASAAWS